jgi:hypothetical protein
MSFFDKLSGRLTAPKLTRGRIAAAMTIACVADVLQIALMPVAWTFAQSAVDVVAMLLAMWVVGFHLLLLPTFILEFIPGVDMLPTWTACMIAVIALRKREQSADQTVIDVDPAPSTKPAELSMPPNTKPPPPPARD